MKRFIAVAEIGLLLHYLSVFVFFIFESATQQIDSIVIGVLLIIFAIVGHTLITIGVWRDTLVVTNQTSWEPHRWFWTGGVLFLPIIMPTAYIFLRASRASSAGGSASYFLVSSFYAVGMKIRRLLSGAE